MSDLDAPTCKHGTTAVRVQNQHLCTALAHSNLFLFVTHVALQSFLPTYVQLEHLPDDQLQDVSPDGRQVGGHPQEVVRVAFLRRGDGRRAPFKPMRLGCSGGARVLFCELLYQASGRLLNKGEVLLQDGHQEAAGAESRGRRTRCRMKQGRGGNQKQNKMTALRVLTRVFLSGAVREKDTIWKK